MSDVIRNTKPETSLSTADFYYDLPDERIAQHPVEPRDSSRLMVLHRDSHEVEHKHFYDILAYLREGDTLVVNDSKVIPARIFGHVEGREEAKIELLLLRQRENDLWECLVKPGKRARVGMTAVYGDGILRGTVEHITDEGNRYIRFDYDRTRFSNLYEILHIIGMMPLPPYITAQLEHNERYNTVYAREEGSAAAPTAGLHFTPELLSAIREKGVGYGEVTLHIGLGTFRPVKVERIEDHLMHTEEFHISEEVAAEINVRRAAGGRIIAVGTTSCRVLESASDENGIVHAIRGETGIFIYPGYRFKAVDALITNFHLPESTLLMLVSALAGKELMMDTYRLAVAEKYRFFSFGDAMFIQ